MAREPGANQTDGMMIVTYWPDKDEGEVSWDGESKGLGVKERKTFPKPDDLKNVDYPEDEDATTPPRPTGDIASGRGKRHG
jgi:hypothetical protein